MHVCFGIVSQTFPEVVFNFVHESDFPVGGFVLPDASWIPFVLVCWTIENVGAEERGGGGEGRKRRRKEKENNGDKARIPREYRRKRWRASDNVSPATFAN